VAGLELVEAGHAEQPHGALDLALQARVRQSYQAQAAARQWVVIDGEQPKDAVAAEVFTAAAGRLGLR